MGTRPVKETGHGLLGGVVVVAAEVKVGIRMMDIVVKGTIGCFMAFVSVYG